MRIPPPRLLGGPEPTSLRAPRPAAGGKDRCGAEGRGPQGKRRNGPLKNGSGDREGPPGRGLSSVRTARCTGGCEVG